MSTTNTILTLKKNETNTIRFDIDCSPIYGSPKPSLILHGNEYDLRVKGTYSDHVISFSVPKSCSDVEAKKYSIEVVFDNTLVVPISEAEVEWVSVTVTPKPEKPMKPETNTEPTTKKAATDDIKEEPPQKKVTKKQKKAEINTESTEAELKVKSILAEMGITINPRKGTKPLGDYMNRSV